MVSEPELLVDSPEVTDPEDVSTDAPEDVADPEVEGAELPDAVDDDPTSKLLARLDGIEGATTQQITQLQNQIRSELGRAQRVEREFQAFKEQVGTPSEPDDSLSVAIANALMESQLLDDRSKASLRSALDGVESAKTARQQAQRERELRESILREVRPGTADEPQDDAQAAAIAEQVRASAIRLEGYAEARGIDFASLGTELNFRPGEGVDAAFTRVKALIDQRAEDGAAGERVATRRQAAGAGSPSRAGATTSLDQIRQRAETEGLPLSDTAARKALAASLGVTLAE